MATPEVPFSFTEGFTILQQMGFFDIILPFLLFFSLSYGALLRAKLFEDQRRINVLIAMSFGLFMSVSLFLVGFTQEFLPWVGVFLIIALGVMMGGGMFLGEDITTNKYIKWVGGLGVMAAILYFAGLTIGFFPEAGVGAVEFEIPAWIWSFFIVLLMIIAPVVYVIMGGSKSGGE